MPRLPRIPKRKLPTPVKLARKYNQVAPLIGQGFSLHQQGKLKEAQTIYEKVLAIQSNHFDALQLLGTLSLQTKEYTKAVDFLTKALKLNPDYAEAYSNRGLALRELKRLDEALVSYDRAISIKPDYAEAYFNRGNALKELKRLDEALVSYDRAISIKPDHAEAYFNRGNALIELKRLDEALVSYDRAISIKPDHADAYSNRGNALRELKRLDEALASYDRAISIRLDHADAYSNRGVVLQELLRLDEALASYDRAISIKPDYADAYSNRGDALRELKRLDEALASYDRAISIKPDYADAYSNRGNALRELKRLDEALVSYDRAISIRPDHAEAYSNRGVVLQEFLRLDEALASYDRAISIKPDYADAHSNLSLCHLLEGNFQDGWQEYEWRLKRKNIKKTAGIRNFSQPLWLGKESLKDKTILLHSEQGLGDTIQFCRYALLVVQLGANAILEVQRPLVNLLKNLEGISQIFSQGDTLPEFDYQCPLLSLPLAFKTDLHSIPPVSQHITSDREKVTKWKTKLRDNFKLRVGLVWSGSAGHENDHNRSLTLAQLLPHLSSNMEYVCLQKEVRDIDKVLLEQHSELKYFSDALEDFTDTAALCELMDFVISVDTSVAHLACTLGKQTWVILPYSPDWRWLLDRDDNPWYPEAKLYRQEKIGDWDSVLRKVNFDLEELVNLKR